MNCVDCSLVGLKGQGGTPCSECGSVCQAPATHHIDGVCVECLLHQMVAVREKECPACGQRALLIHVPTIFGDVCHECAEDLEDMTAIPLPEVEVERDPDYYNP